MSQDFPAIQGSPQLPMAPALEELKQNLDGLTQRATIAELRQWLTATPVALDDVHPYAEFSALGYMRNLVCEGPWYHLLVLCWRSGQRSPIHNHASSTCGVKVLTGVATETVFEPTPCGQLKPTQSVDLHSGMICATQDADTHQVSNLQATGQDLVTLHIYSPPLIEMDQFSITGGQTERYIPMMGYADGGGI